jgi:hypothetical protein
MGGKLILLICPGAAGTISGNVVNSSITMSSFVEANKNDWYTDISPPAPPPDDEITYHPKSAKSFRIFATNSLEWEYNSYELPNFRVLANLNLAGTLFGTLTKRSKQKKKKNNNNNNNNNNNKVNVIFFLSPLRLIQSMRQVDMRASSRGNWGDGASLVHVNFLQRSPLARNAHNPQPLVLKFLYGAVIF